jgi:hypothetical protein
MFRTMRLMLGAAVIVGLTAGAALAQGFRDAGAKARGEFGTGFHSGGGRAMTTYRAMTRYYVAPQVVQTAPAPMAAPVAPEIAQAPAERRSFSVEPRQRPAAPAAPRVIRRYSYQPAAPVYRAPARRGRSTVPTYLLPKTDPRKFGG